MQSFLQKMGRNILSQFPNLTENALLNEILFAFRYPHGKYTFQILLTSMIPAGYSCHFLQNLLI